MTEEYREIITKAVCGKGRKRTKEINEVMPSHQPSSILGCWIINHSYHANQKNSDYVEIHGGYDVNIWYSYDENSKTEVVSERIQYIDELMLSERDEERLGEYVDVIATVVQQPNCIQCHIAENGEGIQVEVEREFVVKLVGETKVTVKIEPVHQIQSNDDQVKFNKSDRTNFIHHPRR